MVRSAALATDARAEARGFVILAALALALSLLMHAPPAQAAAWPTTIALPDGFQPEGIATGRGSTFFVGSIPTGAIVRGDLRTGEIEQLVPAHDDRAAIGLAYRNDVLFVAGGPTGQAYAYDARTGDTLAVFELTSGGTFVNDVVATRDAAYFTDSVNQQLYRVPILGRDTFGTPETLPLTGDIVYVDGFNANGIDATPNGKTLVIVQSNTGKLFTVDPVTGHTTEIDLRGATVENGDGILLDGPRLWVVQNRANLLTLVRLRPDLTSGRVVDRDSHATFDVPTTLARFGDRLALVNARFGTADPQPAEYWVTQIRRSR